MPLNADGLFLGSDPADSVYNNGPPDNKCRISQSIHTLIDLRDNKFVFYLGVWSLSVKVK